MRLFPLSRRGQSAAPIFRYLLITRWAASILAFKPPLTRIRLRAQDLRGGSENPDFAASSPVFWRHQLTKGTRRASPGLPALSACAFRSIGAFAVSRTLRKSSISQNHSVDNLFAKTSIRRECLARLADYIGSSSYVPIHASDRPNFWTGSSLSAATVA